MLNPDMIVHWMQLTAGAGVLQPWFTAGGWDEVERRMQPALDAGVTKFCVWCPFGWTVQDANNTPDASLWGKIPYLVIDDGRAEHNAALAAIIDGWIEFVTAQAIKGRTIYPYAGCPRYDRTILAWMSGARNGAWKSIHANTALWRRLPLMLDAMAGANPQWMIYLRMLAEAIGNIVIAEGQAEPPEDIGWLFMHRDWDAGRLPRIAASRHPWKGCLIRSEADLNGADRQTRVRELVDAGVHVVIDSGTVAL